MQLLLLLLYRVLEIYFYTLIIYVLLSWIPELRQSRFYQMLGTITEPYMRLFRGLIVIGMIDLTPILGFFLFQFGLQALGFVINTM